jgi:cytochrome b6-f complex iron-sulfur subunit
VDKPAEKPAASKPAAASAATKAAPQKAAAPAEVDTASILAAARSTAKPGPISKSELAAEKKPAGKTKLAVPPMPAKPDYARPRASASAAATAGTDRRGFLAASMGVFFGSSLAIGFTSLAVTHLLWVLGLARFMFPNVLIEPPTKFKVGFPDDYAPGQVSEKYKAQFGVWIVRYEWEGQPMIFALKTVCTHLGCTPNWLEGEQKFKCPCHGSGFYKDGVNFEGPAPRPLERYAISTADDGQLLVDKSATFHEETGQWADTASFVQA